jgi:dihydropteroate synthase
VVEKRLAGSLAAAAWAALHGAELIRVHDVAETNDMMVMLDAIRKESRS